MGIKRKTAEIISSLMLTDCPVCIQYCSLNLNEINEAKVFLVPHFQIGGQEEGPGWISRLTALCPTFLALDTIERNKVRTALHICKQCTAVINNNRVMHECRRKITCMHNSTTNKLFCSCTDCLPCISVL